MLFCLIGWMYYQVAYVPGGQAIGYLDALYAKIARRIAKLLGRDKLRGIVPDEELDLMEEQPGTPSAA